MPCFVAPRWPRCTRDGSCVREPQRERLLSCAVPPTKDRTAAQPGKQNSWAARCISAVHVRSHASRFSNLLSRERDTRSCAPTFGLTQSIELCNSWQTFEGSFSALSKPIFASKIRILVGKLLPRSTRVISVSYIPLHLFGRKKSATIRHEFL